jgi:hypothetical protein
MFNLSAEQERATRKSKGLKVRPTTTRRDNSDGQSASSEEDGGNGNMWFCFESLLLARPELSSPYVDGLHADPL